MPELSRLYFESPRGQCAVMLLAALHDLYIKDGLGTVTKQEAIGYIARKHWFALQPEDIEPYPSNLFRSTEPRWHTLIAWARKDCVMHEMMSAHGQDMWGLTRLGRGVVEGVEKRCNRQLLSVSASFLWSVEFKRLMFANYAPNPGDKKRPASFYRDLEAKLFEDLYSQND